MRKDAISPCYVGFSLLLSLSTAHAFAVSVAEAPVELADAPVGLTGAPAGTVDTSVGPTNASFGEAEAPTTTSAVPAPVEEDGVPSTAPVEPAAPVALSAATSYVGIAAGVGMNVMTFFPSPRRELSLTVGRQIEPRLAYELQLRTYGGLSSAQKYVSGSAGLRWQLPKTIAPVVSIHAGVARYNREWSEQDVGTDLCYYYCEDTSSDPVVYYMADHEERWTAINLDASAGIQYRRKNLTAGLFLRGGAHMVVNHREQLEVYYDSGSRSLFYGLFDGRDVGVGSVLPHAALEFRTGIYF